MANFSPADLDLIKQQMLPANLLPQYFSVDSGQYTAIGRDFESFLILQSKDQKQKILTWVKQSKQVQTENKDRDTLLTRFLNLRKTDATQRAKDIEDKLGSFDEFQAGLLTDGTDPSGNASIPEVGLLIVSLQRPIDELLLMRETSYHESNLASTTLTRLKGVENTDNTIRELNSWQTVVTAYGGKSTASTSLGSASALRGAL